MARYIASASPDEMHAICVCDALWLSALREPRELSANTEATQPYIFKQKGAKLISNNYSLF